MFSKPTNSTTIIKCAQIMHTFFSIFKTSYFDNLEVFVVFCDLLSVAETLHVHFIFVDNKDERYDHRFFFLGWLVLQLFKNWI